MADIWVSKEAFLKRLGTGLRSSMADFSVLEPEKLGLRLFYWKGCHIAVSSEDKAVTAAQILRLPE